MSFSKTFRLQSAGAAYNLDLGFDPHRIEVTNYTAWASDGVKVKFYWFKGMTAGYALSEIADDTGINRAIETSNGFTVVTGDSFATNKKTISGATQANPCVITATTHGYGSAGDEITVRIRDVVGMTQLNNNLYRALIINANTFSLKDLDGNAIDSTAYTAYSSGGSVYNISRDVSDSGGYVTLGSTIMHSDSDWLYVTAFIDDLRNDLGDIA